MTIANSFAAKASVAFVAIAMALSMVAPAQAQTAEELQAQIDTLMATIASLQGQLGTTATVSADAYVFTRALTIGSTGADVTALQTYLISAGFSIPAGATGYFGAQTQAAVAAWQAANGVTPAAGYFGPISQAKYNELMAAMPDDSDDDATDDDDDATDDEDVELSGEASLGDVESSDGDDTSLEEGQEAAPVAEFEVEFENGDAIIDRVDVTLVADAGNDEDEPWETFEEVSLWVDGDEVASMAADDEDEYLDEDDGSLRFSGLDIVAMEDEPVTIVVAVTVQGSVDGVADTETWDVDMTEIRFTDADDVTSTEDVDTDAVDFDIEAEGADDEFIIKTSTEDPDATTLQVDEDGTSDWFTVFAFDLDTDDSTNDIEVNDLRVDIVATEDGSTATSTALLINDARIVVDGEEFDADDINHGTTASTTFEIDGDLVIDAGDRVTVEYQVEFKSLAAALEGATIQASIDSANGVEAEGADDIDEEGAATGEEHTLRTSGIEVDNAETSAAVTTVDGATNDYAVFSIEFDVTAFEQDVYISTNPATSTDYEVQDNTGADLSGTGTSTATLDSSADEDNTGDFFLVSEGETETFTLEVTYLPGASNTAARLQLLAIDFDESADITPDQTWNAVPAADYRTSTKTIVN